MQLQHIKAVPHPMGNRIDLQWLNSQPVLFPTIRVMRRKSTYPTLKYPGVLAAEVKNTLFFTVNIEDPYIINKLDNHLLSPVLMEQFALQQIILSTEAAVVVLEPGSKWQVLEGDWMCHIVKNENELAVNGYYSGMSLAIDSGLHPGIVYYYSFFLYTSDGNPVLHIGNRVSAMATGPYDFAGQMYRMLPQIYYRYDKALPSADAVVIADEDKNRGQLRRFLDLPGMQLDQLYSMAAAALDFHNVLRIDGKLLPLLAQWIGWQTNYILEIEEQRNEIKHAPALYRTIGIIPAIEAAIVKCVGGWEGHPKEFVHNVFLTNRPRQLNLWICALDSSGQVVPESDEIFSLDFAYEGRPSAVKDEDGTVWFFYHTYRNGNWDIWYKTLPGGQEWTPSQPLFVKSTSIIDKHPTVVYQDKSLWVFRNSYSRETRTWEIQSRKRTSGQWVDINLDVKGDEEDENSETNEYKLPVTGNQRKSPQSLVDSNNQLWLFWLENDDTRWNLKYNRYNGSNWEDTSADFPLDNGKDPRVEKDLVVLFHSENSIHSIWVFWGRKELLPNGGRGCWEIAYRKKTGIDSLKNGWGNIVVLSKDSSIQVYDDCEPAAIVNESRITLFRASNRSGGWAIYAAQYDDGTNNFGIGQRLMVSPYAQRAPLPLIMDNNISLIFRSNKSISYQSDEYQATRTTDFRWSGSTTVEMRNKLANSLLGKYEDFQTYTYDIGENGIPTQKNWYSRDTIGIFLTPDKDDQQLITKKQEVIKGILDRFLPIQTRLIFIINPPLYREMVYTYDYNGEEPRLFIDEEFKDKLNSVAADEYTGMSDTFEDKVPGWVWLRSWSVQFPDHLTVDFSQSPIDTTFRIWHPGIKNNEEA